MQFRLSQTTGHQTRGWQSATRACNASRPHTTTTLRVAANPFGVNSVMVELGSVAAGNGTVMQAMGEFRLSDVATRATQLLTGTRVAVERSFWITNGKGFRKQTRRPATQHTNDYRKQEQPEQVTSHSGYRYETSIDQLTNRIPDRRFHALHTSREGVAS